MLKIAGIKRGKVSMFKSGVFGNLDGCHGEIFFDGAQSVNRDAILTEIARVCKVPVDSVSCIDG